VEEAQVNRDERLWLFAFMAGLTAISFVVWAQMFRLSPVLFTSRIFFQLILAATFIAMMRNIVGVKAFGVFGPTIVTFALLKAGPLWGLVLFLDVFLVALGTRFVLEPLRMGANHRVAVVITTVALSLTLLEVLGEVVHLQIVEFSLLLPVLITSWLADEFADDLKEMGWPEPSKKLVGTVVLILLSFLLMSWTEVVDFFIRTPPLWVVAIALNIYAARYVRFRLSERLRFKPAAGGAGGLDGVLTMNERNRGVISEFNPPWAFPGVEKAEMKRALHALEIPTPETFMVVRGRSDLETLAERLRALDSFAMKPARGHGGEGIIVIERREGDAFYKVDGTKLSASDLLAHAGEILEGEYSASHHDVAIIEARVVTAPFFDGFYHRGVPDIRVIVLRGFPLMAMTRLPTKESGGAANLHKGAVGVGLRILDGTPVRAFWQGRGGQIENHPDTGRPFKEFNVPGWEAILEVAVRAQAVSRLGYAGVDVVVDAARGPLVLEVNKRPGLAVQNANGEGVGRRIEFVKAKLGDAEFKPIRERLRLAREWDQGGWE
jgi:alpha-L-glutamate ligase-like protein